MNAIQPSKMRTFGASKPKKISFSFFLHEYFENQKKLLSLQSEILTIESIKDKQS